MPLPFVRHMKPPVSIVTRPLTLDTGFESTRRTSTTVIPSLKLVDALTAWMEELGEAIMGRLSRGWDALAVTTPVSTCTNRRAAAPSFVASKGTDTDPHPSLGAERL